MSITCMNIVLWEFNQATIFFSSKNVIGCVLDPSKKMHLMEDTHRRDSNKESLRNIYCSNSSKKCRWVRIWSSKSACGAFFWRVQHRYNNLFEELTTFTHQISQMKLSHSQLFSRNQNVSPEQIYPEKTNKQWTSHDSRKAKKTNRRKKYLRICSRVACYLFHVSSIVIKTRVILKTQVTVVNDHNSYDVSVET